jgi:hypothetical protein
VKGMDTGNTLKDERPPYEVDGPYIAAPDWPWSAAGWVLSALLVLLFFLAWTSGGA